MLLISDANILIDMEEGKLLPALFYLPTVISTPDILFFEELEDQHPLLPEMGLVLKSLDEHSMKYVLMLASKYSGPSRNDLFALALARQEGCPLLSGDKALRCAAIEERVKVHGTIWLMELLLSHRCISSVEAKDAYGLMRATGRRLPWNLAASSLAKFETLK